VCNLEVESTASDKYEKSETHRYILNPKITEDQIIEIINGQDLDNEAFNEAALRMGHLKLIKKDRSYMDNFRKACQKYIDNPSKENILKNEILNLSSSMREDRE
jgi:hypothetical protein